MTEIIEGPAPVTLINVFSVAPHQQDQLIAMLNEATEKTMQHMPGFISANIHKSLDGLRVVNYAQWRSKEDFEAMRKTPQATEHMMAIAGMVPFDAHLYEVCAVHSH